MQNFDVEQRSGSVSEDASDGVISRGIHHKRDFKNYEDACWTYRMTAAGDTQAGFVCVENCRGVKSLTFECVGEDHMLEKYELLDETSDWQFSNINAHSIEARC